MRICTVAVSAGTVASPTPLTVTFGLAAAMTCARTRVAADDPAAASRTKAMMIASAPTASHRGTLRRRVRREDARERRVRLIAVFPFRLWTRDFSPALRMTPTEVTALRRDVA